MIMRAGCQSKGGRSKTAVEVLQTIKELLSHRSALKCTIIFGGKGRELEGKWAGCEKNHIPEESPVSSGRRGLFQGYRNDGGVSDAEAFAEHGPFQVGGGDHTLDIPI